MQMKGQNVSGKGTLAGENVAAILHSKTKNAIMGGMTARATKTERFRSIAMLVCLLMAFNSVQGTVLCLGTSGHVEIESTFHKRCTTPAHPQHTEQQHLSRWVGYEEGEHCGPCVDIPISMSTVKMTRLVKKPNSFLLAPITTIIASDCPSNRLAPITLSVLPHYVQMQNVILLI